MTAAFRFHLSAHKVLVLVALLAFLPLDAMGQIFNVGGRIDALADSWSNGVISNFAINSSDVLSVVGSGGSGPTQITWYWYRNTPTADYKGFTTSLVTPRRNLTLLSGGEEYATAIVQAKNDNFVVPIISTGVIWAQPITLTNNPTMAPRITIVNEKAENIRVLTHSDGAFSLLFVKVVNASVDFCVHHTRFTVSTNGTTPQILFCTSAGAVAETWSDPTDTNTFYVITSVPSQVYPTYKCINANQPGLVSCSIITSATLSTSVTQYFTGRLALNSNAFFFAGMTSGSQAQVIVVDYVAGLSSIMTVTVGATNINLALVDSIVPNAVTLLAFDTALNAWRMFDLYWNSTTKQVSYTTLPTLPLGSNYRSLDWRTPSSSTGPSIFSITSLSSNNPIQISTQFYGRLYCGDGLVFTTGVTTPEQCDSVPNCNPVTCQCPNGASGPNTCNILPTPVAPPVTAPVSPPVVPPVTPPVTVPVPVSSPVDVPVATPVAPPVDVPAAVPSSTTPVATPIDAPIATPITSPAATPSATGPNASPVPVAPIASPTSDTTPARQQEPAAPIAVPATVNPAEPGNSTGIISDPIAPVSEAGASVAVIVPAVVVPVAVASAGVAALVVLLHRRKKKKQSEKASGSSGDDGEDPKSERVKLEPVNYFAVPTPSPELGKDSNTSAGSVGSNASLVSMGSNATIHNPLGEPLPDTPPGTLTSLNTTNRSRTTDDRMDIPYSELKFIKEIGAGAFGKVFLGEWQRTKVAMKISSISSSDEFIREAELLINLRPHPNVVQILGISADGVNVVMIMEFCDGGSLDSLVFKKNPPMSDKIHLLSGIAKGIYHLHKNKIVHRDLAARNILLSRGEPKISDFGMSRKVQEATAHGTTKATVGPIRWMAPECLRSAKYSTKSDVWSFGVLCWEVLSGEEPHLNSDPLTIGVAIRDQGITPSINSEWDPALQSLMMDCWALDPEKRPGFDEICERLSRLDE